MKASKVFNQLVATTAFASMLIAGLPKIALSATTIVKVCKNNTTSDSDFTITLNHNNQIIKVLASKDSGGFNRGGVKTSLKESPYNFSNSKAEAVKNDLSDYDNHDNPICEDSADNNQSTADNNQSTNDSTSRATAIISICKDVAATNSRKYKVFVDHKGRKIEIRTRKDQDGFSTSDVKNALTNRYQYSATNAETIRLKLYDIEQNRLSSIPNCLDQLTETVQLNVSAVERVSLELVLSVDVSGSVDSNEYNTQVQGYISAFNNPDVQDAIKALPDGMAVTMQFWGTENVADIGWFKLTKNGDSIDGLTDFTDAMNGVTRVQGQKVTINGVDINVRGGTDIKMAIDEAKNQLLFNDYEGDRLVMDVSGDGIPDDTPYPGATATADYGFKANQCGYTLNCPPVVAARDEAIAAGITINGLPINGPVTNSSSGHSQMEDQIEEYYRSQVVGGSNSFTVLASGFDDFARAAQLKIFNEISDNLPNCNSDGGCTINDPNIVTAPDSSSDVDNNGIYDQDEVDSDIDGDGLKNFEDLDDDGDSIADVYELYTLSQISNTGTKQMTESTGASVLLPNPPAAFILPAAALNTDNTDEADYQDTDSDNDQFSDEFEAGDTDLGTAPYNSDSSISGDSIADFRDLDSDNNGIADQDEVDSDVDEDTVYNFQDLDDDGDAIIDLIEIGSNPASPTNSDNNANDGYDYQDFDSDNDGLLDADEGIKNSATNTTSISISYPTSNGISTTYNLQDFNSGDTQNNGVNCTNTCGMVVTPGDNGKVTVTGKITGLDYQMPVFAD